MDRRLRALLAEVGLDPDAFGDPAAAFARLHARFGRRATLVDRYALEAAARGTDPDALDRETRARLAREVIPQQLPGWEVVEAAGRTAPDAIAIVPYREEWASGFAEWRGRLQAALGATAVRVEHVGSTAVPGLPAKPVLDVQVSVGDLEDEASYVPAIEELGVALRSRDAEHRYFRPAGDRPRDVQIHVCASASAWEREHLLFRDFLRADPAARAAYARLKLQLAGRYRDDRLAYNEAKPGFVLDRLEEARAWAERIGWTVG
ncbi:MAG TPA: GrpB family protein [Gaiellaceae bacterium]|nr:GrpB family protein [Gaiellaceae bacterium]